MRSSEIIFELLRLGKRNYRYEEKLRSNGTRRLRNSHLLSLSKTAAKWHILVNLIKTTSMMVPNSITRAIFVNPITGIAEVSYFKWDFNEKPY